MNKSLELDAVELTNPQVVRVSLVDRGANRSPIRKLKSEDTMKKNLDLSNLSSLLVQKAAEVPAPQDVVAAIVSLKGEACDNFCAALEAEAVTAVKKLKLK